ncbi:hypothetical protein HJG54_29720 [Leptolyngbya sp. NK1-12]|uniref:Uncharacterized protein n=1 Tax=Leptolyngbya sp. NK1-12 TaxID=2547451 RepID=A0AA97AIM7_9CYAN|nr:hypothetical protein [Leptolyngbya sp. NK1-12]MBF2048691.1 hypothetical protein [Elainella sp. C42_A2020_010]WNZ26850.1 hypothetical protein HJG54_29720 [Leptolyngbya sp. NK1-12]
MLQLVGLITLVLLGAATFFAWLQNRPTSNPDITELEVRTAACKSRIAV